MLDRRPPRPYAPCFFESYVFANAPMPFHAGNAHRQYRHPTVTHINSDARPLRNNPSLGWLDTYGGVAWLKP